ncbi:MAG: HD domain-containing protein [Bacillota bacterium]|nr:HD domain-containing protein [Bacillota bacterium]
MRYSTMVLFMLFLFLVLPSAFAAVVVLWMLRGDLDAAPIGIGISFLGIALTFLYRERLQQVFQLDVSRSDEKDPLTLKLKSLLEKRDSMRQRIEQQDQEILDFENRIQFDNQLSDLHEYNRKMYQSHRDNTIRKIQTMMDLSHQLFAVMRPSGEIEYVNAAFLSRLHYTKDQVIGHNVSEFIIAEEIDKKEAHDRLLKGNDKPTIVSVYSGKDRAPEMISFIASRLDTGHYFLSCRAINDELLTKSLLLTKNREIEYINRVNASLISNNSTEKLLANIVSKIYSLFRIRYAAIYQRQSGQARLMASAGDCEDLSNAFLYRVLAQPNFEQIFDRNHWTMAATLLETEGEQLKLVIVFEKKISTNEVTIIKMFTNQASIVIQRDRIYESIKRRFVGTILGLVDIIEAKDKYTEGHSRRVQQLSMEIANEMQLPQEDIEAIEIASILHDLGKIGIRREVLNKSGRLDFDEYREIQQHPNRGYEILKNIDLDKRILEAVAYHHVHFDLSGYPSDHGLKELPLFAGLIAVADAFDAMTSSRSYTCAKTMHEALDELRRCSGTQFTPSVVEALERLIERDPEHIRSMLNQ